MPYFSLEEGCRVISDLRDKLFAREDRSSVRGAVPPGPAKLDRNLKGPVLVVFPLGQGRATRTRAVALCKCSPRMRGSGSRLVIYRKYSPPYLSLPRASPQVQDPGLMAVLMDQNDSRSGSNFIPDREKTSSERGGRPDRTRRVFRAVAEATRKFQRRSSSSYFKKRATRAVLRLLGDGFEDRRDPYQEMRVARDRGGGEESRRRALVGPRLYRLSFLLFLLLLPMLLLLLLLFLRLFLFLLFISFFHLHRFPVFLLPRSVSRNDSSFVTNRCGGLINETASIAVCGN